MLIRCTLVIGLWLSFAIAYGQTVPFPTTDITDNTVPYHETMDNVFSNLDLTDVTSGLLYDRSWKLAEPAAFDGSVTSDTIVSHAHWLKLYGTMVTSAVTHPGPIPGISSWKAQRDAEEKAGKNPLVIMHVDYHRIKQDSALVHSLIYSQNDQLYDHPNQSTSPYEAQTLVAFSPFVTTIYDSLSMDFKTAPEFFKTNTGLTASTVQVDFGNGSGWQSMGVNATAKITWSTFGKKTLKLRITYTNNEVYEAKSTVSLVETPKATASSAKYNQWWNALEHISHPDPAYADHGIDLQIAYGCGNNKLVKPFIYVEGFSPDFAPNETYQTLYNRLITYQNNNEAGYQLLDELAENGYDIVYVDFKKGTGNILENAQTLKKAIKWINDEKAANGSSQPNVVAGYSMGGLVSRLALRQMELGGWMMPIC